MATEHVVGRPIPLSLDLSLLAERVLNSLSRGEKLTDADRIVLKKAAQFLEEVQRGGQAVRSLELGATSGRDIQSFSLAMSAYELLTKKHNKRTRTERTKEIDRLLDIATRLAQAEDISPWVTDVPDLREFFESAKKITARLNAGEIDRVHIG